MPFVTAILVTLFLACSASTRHRVISTLFDGVPPLDTAGAQTIVDTLSTEVASPVTERSTFEGVSYTLHAPYEEKMCTECHLLEGTGAFGKSVRLRVPMNELCMECHDDMSIDELRNTYDWIHGPVAAGACTGCHSPHTALYPALLLAEPGRPLCIRCHDENRLAEQEIHEDSQMNCLTCHAAHGADAIAFNMAETVDE